MGKKDGREMAEGGGKDSRLTQPMPDENRR